MPPAVDPPPVSEGSAPENGLIPQKDTMIHEGEGKVSHGGDAMESGNMDSIGTEEGVEVISKNAEGLLPAISASETVVKGVPVKQSWVRVPKNIFLLGKSLWCQR